MACSKKCFCEECNPPIIELENPVNPSVVTKISACEYLHVSGDGTGIIINTDPEIELIGNCDGTITLNWKDNNSATVDICKEVASGCNATLIENVDGTLTFTDNAGVSTTIAPGGSTLIATAAFTATNGIPVGIGDYYILFTDGTTWAGGTIIVATSAFVASNAVSVSIGDPYILLPNGDTWGSGSGGSVQIATAAIITTNGILVQIGEPYILFPNGQTWASQGGVVNTAAIPFNTTNGILIQPGESYIDLPNGNTWARPEQESRSITSQANQLATFAYLDTLTLNPTDTPDPAATPVTTVANLSYANNTNGPVSMFSTFNSFRSELEIVGSNTVWVTYSLVAEVLVDGFVIVPASVFSFQEYLSDPGPGGLHRRPVQVSQNISWDTVLLASANPADIDGFGRLLPGHTLDINYWLAVQNNNFLAVADGWSPNPASNVNSAVVRGLLSVNGAY